MKELPKILIVDDKPANLLALESILCDLDIEIIRANSGEEALAITLRHSFFVVLLDVMMPGMSGLEVASLMQGYEKTMQTPVIFVTAQNADELEQLKGYATGAADYIVKPVNPEILLSKVRLFLKLYLQTAELREKYEETASLEQILNEKNLELKENISALEKTNIAFKRSNEELEQFSHAISHDLQEPLRMVSSFMRLLEKGYQDKLDEKANEYIYFAMDGAKRMSVMIKDLLDYSRVGRDDTQKESVSAKEAVDSACINLRLSIEETDAKIQVQQLPMIYGNQRRLVQVFQNLIGNAIKYRNPEVTPEIQIDAELVDGDWRFSVKDNGIGIAANQIDRVFIVFQRLHSVKEYPGNGVGLSTCRKVVEELGGRIWVESIPTIGSTFYFTIPNIKLKELPENSNSHSTECTT